MDRKPIVDLNVEKVIEIHDYIIEFDKALNPDDYLPGIHEIGSLETLFEWRIHSNNSVFQNAAFALDSITCRHAFRNGNKRTGFAVAYILLEAEGYKIIATEDERLQFLLKIARYEVDVGFIETWLRQNSRKMGRIEFLLNWVLKRKEIGIVYLFVKVLLKCIPNDYYKNINEEKEEKNE
ncbi:death-on-curing family protein [Methanolobus vulcani]|uniref:Death-on-curing family protein n=1 Tax=Methanolobus vulcani TaxID=38026 RepID=A0A7Z7FFM5_9EURY|nr:type II toxin-antitoxin system death-on-curing family toxin [Methanolobus vulcani]SDG34703.1 death-on-curing family protein [Methanolobus vulcani]